MKFSIVVPVYNVEAYIRHCIESIIAQTFDDYELILVNDGTKDKSKEICEEYERKYENIVLVNKENGGLTSARKAGACIAKGDFVICVDGDDYIHRDLLSEISKAINQNPETDVVCFGYYKDVEGRISTSISSQLPAGVYKDMRFVRDFFLYDDTKIEDNMGCLIFSIWSKAIRRSVYVPIQMSIPDETKIAEDVLLTAHILSKAQSMVVLNYAGYYYRDNPSSMTHVRNARDLVDLANVTNEIEKIGTYKNVNIVHYYINSICMVTFGLAKKSRNFKEFKNVLKALDFDSKYSQQQAYNKSMCFRQKLKYILIQKKLWFVLFCLSKYVLGRKA